MSFNDPTFEDSHSNGVSSINGCLLTYCWENCAQMRNCPASHARLPEDVAICSDPRFLEALFFVSYVRVS